MRILVIADDESLLQSWEGTNERIDLVIACGDLFNGAILDIARRCHCTQIFAVKGNHDTPSKFPSPIRDLHLNILEFEGLRFGGFAGSWKYKPRGNFLFEQHEVSSLLSSFPGVDIFVAHNSPRYVHDREDEVHLGFDAFNDYIKRAGPRIMLHGHQHITEETTLGDTRVLGTFGVRLVEV